MSQHEDTQEAVSSSSAGGIAEMDSLATLGKPLETNEQNESQAITASAAKKENVANNSAKRPPSKRKEKQRREAESPPTDPMNGGVLESLPAQASTGKAQKSSTNNKTYAQLIQEAIEAIDDRTGSSIPAIRKWLLQEYTHLEDSKHFRQRINQGIKTAVSQGRFEKIRCSYRISATWKADPRNKKRKSGADIGSGGSPLVMEGVNSTTYELLVKQNKAKLQKLAKTLPPDEFRELKTQLRRKEEAVLRKEEVETREAERLDRIRKRRFPMEDTKLHEEDKELCVKAPPDVKTRPSLPYFWQTTMPLDAPGRQGKTSDQVLRNSKADGLDQGSCGLVPDLLQVYHFFRGDVHFTGHVAVAKKVNATARKKRGSRREEEPPEPAPLVPDFALSNLIYSVEEILNGNARKSRLVPPLISHLFVTCLQLLCREPDDAGANQAQKHLQFELNKYLLPALTPGSWSDVCHLYMDAMERFYSTDSSRGVNVLQPLTTDLKYLFGHVACPTLPETVASAQKKGPAEGVGDAGQPLPEGYGSYIGDCRGVLARAHEKLGRLEPWFLSAEELMSLLRALTDDLLGSSPLLAEQMAKREEEMFVLRKEKKAADSEFRKLRLAYEGPKKSKKASGAEKATEEKTRGEAFKPSATKKEFDNALKKTQKADEALENGINHLVARTEPIGYDRNHNAVYCFSHDPEILYVEELRPPANPSEHALPQEYQFRRLSWHVIETSSLFDAFVSSLDTRGKREQDLQEGLLGQGGPQQSLRRHLHDDVRLKAEFASRKRERESLCKRLETAKLKCDEEKGRRSGRLADSAEEELAKVQKEFDDFERASPVRPATSLAPRDDLTGLALLRTFDSVPNRRETRRLKEKKDTASTGITHLPCSALVPTGNVGSGIVGMNFSRLVELEQLCQSVDSKPKTDLISTAESVVHTWYQTSLPEDQTLGSSSVSSHAASAKKRRVSDSSSVHSVIGSLKQALLDLEERVATITYYDIASRDAELADDNISTVESAGVEKVELDVAWKKQLHRLRKTAARPGAVRERLVRAISLARKARATHVVSELRAALMLFDPAAPNESKDAAIQVLVSHGDFTGSDGDEVGSDDGGDAEDKMNEELVSVLSAEAALLTGCLGRSDEATRKDWIELVKSCKTLSRLSSLIAAFGSEVEAKLQKISEERDDLLAAISAWQSDAAGSGGKKKKKSKTRGSRDYSRVSEVWADVKFTSEIRMAKAEDWPWWPGKICQARDEELQRDLAQSGRTLVALIGEMGGLRVVKDEMIRPFTGSSVVEEGSSEIPKKTRLQLDECLALARRIQRGSSEDVLSKHLP